MPYTPNGLWIPDTRPSNKFTAQDVKKDGRIYLRGRGTYESLSLRYSTVDHWVGHSRGRMDVLPDVMTKVAVLRSRGRIPDSQPVTSTGAVYQDFRGVPEHHQRAHRFFCNPWVGVFTLPDLAFSASGKFWREMSEPLAVTDIVPNFINAGDSATEKGMYGPVTEAVKEVIHEQRPGKQVNPKLIDHVVRFVLIPAYQHALERALGSVRDRSDKWYERLTRGELFSADALRALERESLTAKPNPAKTTEALQSIEDYLWLSLRDARTYQPTALLYTKIQSETARLNALSD